MERAKLQGGEGMKQKSVRARYLFSNLALFLGGALFLFLDRLDLFDFILVCPWHLLGIYCPTCGLTRAVHACLSLDFSLAMRLHPLLPVAAACFLYYEVFGLAAAIKNEGRIFRRATPYPLFATIGLFFAFFILRNILLFSGIDLVGDFTKGFES